LRRRRAWRQFSGFFIFARGEFERIHPALRDALLFLVQQGEQFFTLVSVRWTAQSAAESVVDAVGGGLAAFNEHLVRERLGALDKLGFVQRDERLQRRVRALAPDAREIAVWRVERLQHRIRHRAELEDVKAATVT